MKRTHGTILFTCLLLVFSRAAGARGADRVVVDRLNRTVSVPEPGPRRVVPMVPSMAEMLVWLGVADRVAGVVQYTPNLPQLQNVPQVGGPLNPSYETIADLDPDLVILSRNHNPRELAETLDRLHIPYVVVVENTLDDMLANLELLARIFNRETRYRVWSQQWRNLWNCLHNLSWRRRPKVLLLLSVRPIFTVGRGSFITEVLHASGLEVVSQDLPNPWPQVSLEQVAAWDPDRVLIPEPNFSSLRRAILASPAWRTLSAVRRARIEPVPENILRATPYLFQVIRYLVAKYHLHNDRARACLASITANHPGHPRGVQGGPATIWQVLIKIR